MRTGPVSTPSLRAARLLVAAMVVGAPLAHAGLLAADGVAVWSTLIALVAGGAARALLPQATWPLLAVLALGPLWQLGAGLVAGHGGLAPLMPWLAALGAWLAWPPAGRAPWGVTGAWRFGVVTWALVLAAAWPVTALRELDFTRATIGVATANGALGLTPELSAAMVALTAQAQIVALLLFDWLWSAVPAVRRRAWLALGPGVAAACGLALWQQLADPAFLSAAPWTGLARAAGPFYDANAMGALAALVAGGLALPALCPAAVPRWLWSGGWTLLGLGGVVASGSRSALAALLVSGAVLALARLRPRHRVAALAALAVCAVIALAAARLAPAADEPQGGHALGRLAGTLRRVASGGAGELLWVAWRRDGYGPASLAVVADHPWVGVGPGVFGNVVTDYAWEALALRVPPDNAQNWWRQQLAELGTLGAAAPFLCSLLALLAVGRAWRRAQSDPGRTAPLLALGLMALVSPPTQHPVLQVLAGLLVASAVAPEDAGAVPGASRRAGLAGPLAWVLAVTCATGLAVEGWTVFRPVQRASRFHFLYYYGLSAPVDTPFGGGRWSARRSTAVVPPAPGSQLVVHLILPHDDLATAPVTVVVGDGTREVCRLEGRSHDKLECRMPVVPGRWPIVEIAVSRPWRTVDGVEQAALVAGRFDP